MATFTVCERHTLWLRAISIRTSGMIPMSCKINTTNGRPVSLGGRIAMSKPSRGTYFAVGLDGLHDALARHRNTSIIPASRDVLARSPSLPSVVGAAATSGSGSAGAPGPGAAAAAGCAGPERGSVGPCAAGWIAGPSPSKRHLPITPLSRTCDGRIPTGSGTDTALLVGGCKTHTVAHFALENFRP